jgi:two-component system cell cycle response regulator
MKLCVSAERNLEENSNRRGSVLHSIIPAKKSFGKSNYKKVRLLIVDDEVDLCEILAHIFYEKGYFIDTTPTFSEAIEKMKNAYYHLMITDIRLPDRSGIELLEVVEKISPDTAIIVITAFPETETAIRALNSGAFSYLTKPFSHKELLSVVDRALAKQNFFLRNIQLFERLRRKKEKFEKLSITDRLTGLYNRTYFEEMLNREELRLRRYKRPMAIMMIDINDLKYINDHFGHLKGDMIIKETAKILRKTCRASDVVARYGGDEFVILLPETTQKGTSFLANSLRKAVRQWNLYNTDPDLTLNLAFGYACVENGVSLTNALSQADANMYQDKMSQKALVCYQ